MEELSKRFPKGIAYAMHYDTTRFVSAAMHDVVIDARSRRWSSSSLVVFIFLQSWRTTLIPIDRHPGVADRDARRSCICSASRSTC